MKKILATLLTATLVVANCVPAFAESSATGNGVVEYDNSEAVEYDVIQVPTVADSTYAFTLDPTGLLHTYDSSNYDAGTIYFNSQKTPASVEAAKSGVNLFTQSKEEVTDNEGVWEGIIDTQSSGTGDDITYSIKSVETGYFVWVPVATADNTYTKGSEGKFEALTKENIENWFDFDGVEKTISLKKDHKVLPNVCDGKLYQNTYTAVTGNKISDSPTDRLSNYVTITDGAISAYPNLYKSVTSGNDTTYSAPAAGDVKYNPAVIANQGTTDKVTVINKSTKAKVVKATVTLSNVEGITFKENDNSYTDDTAASMYVAATNDTTTEKLVYDANSKTAKATYTVNLAAPTIGEITYMSATQTNAATGGHDYAKYEANGTEYGSDSFYIKASANPNGATAWNTLLKNVTATTRPTFSIVYSVDNNNSGKTITFHANYTDADPETATASTGADGKVTAPSTITRDGYSLEGWYEDAECTPAKKVDLTAKTFAADADLYANWTSNNVAPSISPASYDVTAGNGVEVTVNLGSGNLAAESITSITYKNANNQDRTMATTDYTFADGKISIASSVVDGLFTNNVASRAYTVTFNNNATATFTLVTTN